MLHLQNISFEFGGNYLFRDVDWFIKPRERIALVGKNGAGKSTLFRLITGEYEVREGTINKQGSLEIGYLSQDMVSHEENETVLDTALKAFEEALDLHKQIESLLSAIESDPSDENIEKLADMQERFAAIDGYTIENRTAAILEGLGFKTTDLHRPFSEFSGGWRMRVILARMLLLEPDIMLLDEPTNHLDLPSIEWLESYLINYPGTVVIVSHDREFLNRMTTKTVELSHQQLYIWEGNYDFYLQARDERDDLLVRRLENQKQYIKDQEKFINRFRYKASKAKAVQSRIKMLEKLDKVEVLEEDSSGMRLKFNVGTRSGKVLMKLHDVSKNYGDNHLFDHVNLEINRGDKIALIGANGTGKSTLLRIIADVEPFEGERQPGHNVQESFYAQHQLESLHLENELLDELKQAAPYIPETELRTLLGCFLFTGDDVYKKVKVLSGGEKARLALAKTLVSKANFLMLDEPTNHLDMASIEILIDALRQYEGTLIFVSHNRYFISKLANKVLTIKDRNVVEYPGTYEEYQYKLSQLKNESIQKSKTEHEKKSSKSSWKQRDETEDRIRKLRKSIEQKESEIEKMKTKLESLEEQLAQPDLFSPQDLKSAGIEHAEVTKKIASVEDHLDQLLEDLIRLED